MKSNSMWDAYDAHEVGNAVEEVVTGAPDPVVFEAAAEVELKWDKIATANYCTGPVKYFRPRPLADCAAKTMENDDCGDSGIFIWKGVSKSNNFFGGCACVASDWNRFTNCVFFVNFILL